MNFVGKILLFSALFAIPLSSFKGLCGEANKHETGQHRSQASVQRSASGINIGVWLASMFREHISAVDGERCPSYPSCASYSVAAFKKHGFFMGWLMTVDRLIHEGDEGAFSPIVYDNGQKKILDPVKNNDFWWSGQDGKDKN